jgi:uncharacterized protein YecE (DUF72 family)
MVLRIGPAGWSYPDWKGKVYPPKIPRGFEPLQYLSNYFDTIEINSTFYGTPDATRTQRWAQQVSGNPAFKFTAKLPRLFTHTYQASARDEAAFKRAVEPLQGVGRLGALLLQFPYAFHHTPENRAYVRELAQRFGQVPLVLEVRHRSWDQSEVYAFLQELGMGFCNIDQPQVSYSLGLTRHVTSAVGYLRLHGRNTGAWFQEDAGRDARYDYLYSGKELEEITEALLIITAQAQETYLVTNNHFRGQAALNALELRHRVNRVPVDVPPQLLSVYPQLATLMRSGPGQECPSTPAP